MSPRRALTEAEVREAPWALWNAFVELLATSSFDDLESRQIPAHLALLYDSEVQNGGHFQYFENHGLESVPRTIDALRNLGANAQAEVLSEALQVALQHHWGTVATAEQFASEAHDSEFLQSDVRWHDCSPSITELLERHLQQHSDWYIELRAT